MKVVGSNLGKYARLKKNFNEMCIQGVMVGSLCSDIVVIRYWGCKRTGKQGGEGKKHKEDYLLDCFKN